MRTGKKDPGRTTLAWRRSSWSQHDSGRSTGQVPEVWVERVLDGLRNANFQRNLCIRTDGKDLDSKARWEQMCKGRFLLAKRKGRFCREEDLQVKVGILLMS